MTPLSVTLSSPRRLIEDERTRQDGLPFDDGVVSGMAMIMSISPAVATIARLRKAAL
jgi:hypothetical protein